MIALTSAWGCLVPSVAMVMYQTKIFYSDSENETSGNTEGRPHVLRPSPQNQALGKLQR